MKRTDFDCRLGAEKRLPCCSFHLFSKKAQGKESLLTVQADVLCEKNARHGSRAVVSEIDDRCWLLSGIVGVPVRSIAC